jgi:hypothetical protein
MMLALSMLVLPYVSLRLLIKELILDGWALFFLLPRIPQRHHVPIIMVKEFFFK